MAAVSVKSSTVYYVRISYNVVLSSRSLHFVSYDLTDTYYYALSENLCDQSTLYMPKYVWLGPTHSFTEP